MVRRILSVAALLTLVACGPKRPPPDLRIPVADADSSPLVPSNATEVEFAGGRRLYATWVEPAEDEHHAFRFSSWDGKAWSAPATVATNVDPQALNGREPSLQELGDGTLVARWFAIINHGEHAALIASSTDGGANWARPIAMNRDVGQGDGPFTWVDSGRVVPFTATIFPYNTVLSDPAPSAVLTMPTEVGAVKERTLLAWPVTEAGGISATRTADSMLVAFRPIAPKTSLDAGESAVTVVLLKNEIPGHHAAGSWHDGWKIPSGKTGIGPVVASRKDVAAVAWYSPLGGPTVRASFWHDRRFGWTAKTVLTIEANDLHIAVVDDETAIAAWTNGKALYAQRFGVTSRDAGHVLQLETGEGDVGIRWMGEAAGAPWIVWSDRGAGKLHLTRVEPAAAPSVAPAP